MADNLAPAGDFQSYLTYLYSLIPSLATLMDEEAISRACGVCIGISVFAVDADSPSRPAALHMGG